MAKTHQPVVLPQVWPALPYKSWEQTCATLHMWTQIVGKVRMAFSPHVNHWWQVPLYVSVQGLSTSPIPYHDGLFEIVFDFHQQQVVITTSDGRMQSVPLRPQSVASFYHQLMAALHHLGIEVTIFLVPQEVENPIPFDQDEIHKAYDANAALRFWQILVQSSIVMHEFRSRFLGKVSPVHFFWGSFDLAVTRFSGRKAPVQKGVDRINQEAYSHEVSSAGFWPGNGPILGDAAFYSYVVPEPSGFAQAAIRPASAFYQNNQYFLRYDDVRQAADPHAMLLDFFQSTYDAAANLGHWNRRVLERSPDRHNGGTLLR